MPDLNIQTTYSEITPWSGTAPLESTDLGDGLIVDIDPGTSRVSGIETLGDHAPLTIDVLMRVVRSLVVSEVRADG